MKRLPLSWLAEHPVVLPLASDEEVAQGSAVMRQLRSELTHAAYCEKARQMMASDGYRLLAVVAGGAVLALAGYRIVNMLSGSRLMVIDDLVCDAAHRGRGHASRLLEALKRMAQERLCSDIQVALDAAHCPEVLQLCLHAGFTARGVGLRLDLQDCREPPADLDPW